MKLIKLLKDIGKLIAGTHFVTAYGTKRGGKRKKVERQPHDIHPRPKTVEEMDGGMPIYCEHGKGMTDYCQPCGRIHGGG
jgi:hypothetical protein